MARREVGKVQEMLTVSSREQQEAAEESESSEDKKQTVVGWISYHGSVLLTNMIKEYKHINKATN